MLATEVCGKKKRQSRINASEYGGAFGVRETIG